MSSTTDPLVKLLGKDVTARRDYAAMLAWGIDKIPDWTEQWTDFSITDPGILFFNAGAYQYDMLNYVLDRTYLNNILRTTKSLQSIHFMSQFVGVSLPSYLAPIATVLVSNPTPYDVKIPKDFPVFVRDKATGEEVWFYNLNDVVVSKENEGLLKMIEGKRTELDLTYEAFDAHNQFHMPIENIGLNTISVFIQDKNDGIIKEIEKVDDALLNISKEMSFSAHYTYGQTYIKLPPGSWEFLDKDSLVKVRFGITKGKESNMGEVEALGGDKIIYDYFEVQEQLSFKVLSAIGGQNPLSLEDARVEVGDSSWRVETLTTEDDYNVLAQKNFNGDVVRFVIHQEQGDENIYVYYLPIEGLSSSRKNELEEEIIEKITPLMFGGIKPHLQEMSYQKVSFIFEVCLKTNSSDTSRIEEDIISIINETFDRKTQPKEMLLQRSRILGKIELIHEVSYAVCLSPTSDTRAQDNIIYVPGGIDIKFVQKGKK